VSISDSIPLHLFERRAAGDTTAEEELRQAFQAAPLDALGERLLAMERPMVLDTQALWRARSEELLPFLCATLSAPDAAVERRISAAELLTELCSPACCQAVLDVALRGDTEPPVRTATLAALERLFFAGLIGDDAARSVVFANHMDKDEAVRVELVKLAATSSQEWSLRHIEGCLRDSDAVVQAALQALVQHRHPDSLRALARSLDVVPEHLRQDASVRLRQREEADARTRAETIVSEGRFLGVDDVNHLVQNKQYATVLRFLKEHKIELDGVNALKAIDAEGETSKNQRTLLRKIKLEANK
jgi:hypothetical protein